MSNVKMNYIAQFHTKHLNCARCTSNSRTRSSSMCAERRRCLQPVHAVRRAVNSRRSDPRQRRPADRVCYTLIPRNDQAMQVGWSSMSTGNVGDRSAAAEHYYVRNGYRAALHTATFIIKSIGLIIRFCGFITVSRSSWWNQWTFKKNKKLTE